MSARRNISQRTAPPQQQNNVRSAMNGPRFSDGQQQQEQATDIKKMHPMAVLSMHEERINDLEDRVGKLQSGASSQPTSTKRSTTSDESAMIAECVKQIKFLTQENQTNRNLARELTLELLRLKTSLQEDGRIEMHISEETQAKFETFKESANRTQSQSVREELLSSDNGASTVSFSGNGGYDPNAL
jgi:hypothetical protein